jgi:hypothetical protein
LIFAPDVGFSRRKLRRPAAKFFTYINSLAEIRRREDSSACAQNRRIIQAGRRQKKSMASRSEQHCGSDVMARMNQETYALRAIACLHAAEQAKTRTERDRWIFEAIAWHDLARNERPRSDIPWPSSEQLRARRLN